MICVVIPPPTEASRGRRLVAGASLVVLMGLPAAGQATPPTLPAAQSYSQATSTDYAGGTCDSGLQVGTSTSTAACAVVSPGSQNSSLASAAFGSVRITANADTQSLGLDPYSGNAWSSASFVDAVAISGPAGKSGLLTGTIFFSGALGATATGSPNAATNAGANYNFSASFFGQNVGLGGSVLEATNGTSMASNPQGGAFTVTALINFDATGWAIGSVTMSAVTQAESSARPFQPYSGAPIDGATASASAAFGHTLYWGGISSLTVDGVEYSGYDLVSASGTDYRLSTAPVPEAGTAAMMLAGMAVVGWRQRRGRC